MVGVLYKPANQQVAAITTRNDKLGGQGPPSPTLSGSTNGLPLESLFTFVICLLSSYQWLITKYCKL